MSTHTVLFSAARKIQSSLNIWVDCRHDSCRERKACTGGPRGTCAKTGGWPICTEEGRERLKIAKSRRHWLGENAPEDETQSQRNMRRLNQDIEDARFKMQIAGFLNQ